MKINFYQPKNTRSDIKQKTEMYCQEKDYTLNFFSEEFTSVENLILHQLTNTPEEYDYVVYLGSEFYINNFNIEIEDIVNEDYLVSLVGQPIFMIVKNCKESIELFSKKIDFVRNPNIYTYPGNGMYTEKPHLDRIGQYSSFLSSNSIDGRDITNENNYIVNVYHSGKKGDVLNSIPFVRNIANKTQSKINFILKDENMFKEVSSLLINFDFISSVEILDTQLVNYDLFDFRSLEDVSGNSLKNTPLPISYYKLFDEPLDENWGNLGLASIQPTMAVPKSNYSIFSYTGRYAAMFDWSAVLNDFKGLMFFIGTIEEYNYVKNNIDKKNVIKGILKCDTLMDMFNYIYYSENYYGSISVVSNIANHLGKPCYIEDGFRNKTVMYGNHNYHLLNNKDLDLYLHEHPYKKSKKEVLKKLPIDLIAVDCVDVNRVVSAINICEKYFTYNNIKLLTSIPSIYPNKHKIAPINSILEYSNFMLGELNKHIESSHCLVIQHDGFIYDPNNWNDDFLQYDYIGAPVISYDGPEPIQNGGFSLRSKRLMDRISEIYKREGNPKGYSEDYYIFSHRKELEVEGFRYAPIAVAEKFSCEPLFLLKREKRECFGFHYFYGAYDLTNGVGIQ